MKLASRFIETFNLDLPMITSIRNNRLLPILAITSLAPLSFQNVEAATTFSSSATVTYTINSISNLTNPGDLSGLNINGSFELANTSGNPYQFVSGDGSITPTLGGAGITSLTPVNGNVYSRTFQLDGATSNGTVSTNYLTWFNLGFNNASTTDNFSIDLSLSYDLHTVTDGDNAVSDVTVNFFNEDGSVSGSDHIDATGSVLLNTHALNFTLAAGQSEKLYVDASISGELQAAPVPLPSAVWFFISGLMSVLWRSKRKAELKDAAMA